MVHASLPLISLLLWVATVATIGVVYYDQLSQVPSTCPPQAVTPQMQTPSPPKRRVAVLIMGQYRTFQEDLPTQLQIFCEHQKDAVFDFFVLAVCGSEKEEQEEASQRRALTKIVSSACQHNMRIVEYYTDKAGEPEFKKVYLEERYELQHTLRPLVANALNISDAFVQNRFTPNLYAFRYWTFRKMLAFQAKSAITYDEIV